MTFDYDPLPTIYSAQFKAGQVSAPRLLDSICLHQPSIVNFDVDITPDGEWTAVLTQRLSPKRRNWSWPNARALVLSA